jgi:hypothetical protein
MFYVMHFERSASRATTEVILTLTLRIMNHPTTKPSQQF